MSSAPVLPSLIPLGVEAVVLAFRLGLHVQRVAERLEVSRNGRDSWSLKVDNITELEAQAAISLFHANKVRPHLLRVGSL